MSRSSQGFKGEGSIPFAHTNAQHLCGHFVTCTIRLKWSETRRKIIVGSVLTTEALKDPKIARWMAATLRKNITREVDQKELAGLLADLDEGAKRRGG